MSKVLQDTERRRKKRSRKGSRLNGTATSSRRTGKSGSSRKSLTTKLAENAGMIGCAMAGFVATEIATRKANELVAPAAGEEPTMTQKVVKYGLPAVTAAAATTAAAMVDNRYVKSALIGVAVSGGKNLVKEVVPAVNLGAAPESVEVVHVTPGPGLPRLLQNNSSVGPNLSNLGSATKEPNQFDLDKLG